MFDRPRKRHGARWLIDRLSREYYAPTRQWSRVVVDAYLDARSKVLRHFRSKIKRPLALYDLRICANTFDFAYFLYDADTHFRALGFDRFQVCILDREAFGLGEYEAVVGWDKRRSRVQSMIVPMAEMYQGCGAAMVTQDDREVIALCRTSEPIFPLNADGRHLRTHNYVAIHRKLDQHRPYSGFRAPRAAVDEVRLFKERRGITQPAVTLTIRAYRYQALRNTDLDAYFRFADYLRQSGFAPILIPDAEAPDAVDLSEFVSFPEACADLHLRMAMYEESFTNVFTSNGVHAIAALNEKCSFMLALLNEAYPSSTGLTRFEADGLRLGDQPFGGTTKRFIWAKESFENLRENFEIIRSHRNADVRAAEAAELRELS